MSWSDIKFKTLKVESDNDIQKKIDRFTSEVKKLVDVNIVSDGSGGFVVLVKYRTYSHDGYLGGT